MSATFNLMKQQNILWSAAGRAAALGAVGGLTQMIIDPPNGQISGLGIVGRQAGELITEGVPAIAMGAVAEDIALSMLPHPTLSEGGEKAAESFWGTASHISGHWVV